MTHTFKPASRLNFPFGTLSRISAKWRILFSLAAFGIGFHNSAPAIEPLQVSADGRYLETTSGNPVYLIGDTAWMMPQKVASKADLQTYLRARKDRGFNLIQVMFLFKESFKSDTEGNPAFLSESPIQPNEAFWSRMDWVIDTAEEEDMYLMVFPAWARWIGELATNSTKMRRYGEFIGARYGDEPHIIWGMGGDMDFTAGPYRAFAEGFMKGRTGLTVAWNQSHPRWKEVLFTSHAHNGKTSRTYLPGDQWLSLNSGYTYRQDLNFYKVFIEAYENEPGEPLHFVEGHYELEGTDVVPYSINKFIAERWHPATGGAFGSTMGNERIWRWGQVGSNYFADDRTWLQQFNTEGTRVMDYFGRFWRARDWWTFVPSKDGPTDTNKLVMDNTGPIYSNKWVTATHSVDLNQTVVFFPYSGRNSARIDLNHLGDVSDTISATWFNPRTNSYSSTSTRNGGTTETFTRPSGSTNYVLVLQGSGAVDPNAAPVISSGPTASGNPVYGTSVTLTVTASDSDNDSLTYDWSKVSGPGTVTFNPDNGTEADETLASFTEPGNYTLRVTVDDGNGGTDENIVQVEIILNEAPVITSGPSAAQNPVTGTSVLVTVGASDGNSDDLVYDWSTVAGPGTVVFNPNSGPGADSTVASFPAVGSYTLKVSVGDGNGGSDSGTVDIEVVQTPAAIRIQPLD